MWMIRRIGLWPLGHSTRSSDERGKIPVNSPAPLRKSELAFRNLLPDVKCGKTKDQRVASEVAATLWLIQNLDQPD